jgi:hypothetical protein
MTAMKSTPVRSARIFVWRDCGWPDNPRVDAQEQIVMLDRRSETPSELGSPPLDPQAAGLDLDQFEMIADPQRATEDEIAVDPTGSSAVTPSSAPLCGDVTRDTTGSSPPVRPGNVLPLSRGRLLAAANARRIHCSHPASP